jgi:hypothetical protein
MQYTLQISSQPHQLSYGCLELLSMMRKHYVYMVLEKIQLAQTSEPTTLAHYIVRKRSKQYHE